MRRVEASFSSMLNLRQYQPSEAVLYSKDCHSKTPLSTNGLDNGENEFDEKDISRLESTRFFKQRQRRRYGGWTHEGMITRRRDRQDFDSYDDLNPSRDAFLNEPFDQDYIKPESALDFLTEYFGSGPDSVVEGWASFKLQTLSVSMREFFPQ